MNLKKYLDAVNTAEARVQQIAAQIDEHFEAEKTDEALALKPQLDEARAKAKGAGELYLSMLNANGGGQGQHLTPVGGDVQVVRDAADQPWKDAREFFKAIKNAGVTGFADPRLTPLRDATGMSEGVPADGGYLVIPQWAAGILERMYTNGDILRRVAQDPVTGNSMNYNGVDETSRANGSRLGGITSYWVSEGGTITPSKPKFRQVELKVKKVAALCYATDEQLEDIANLESWLARNVPEELLFSVEDAIISGDGVGKPLGILNAPCLLTLLRVDASEVDAVDLANMWAHRFVGLKDYAWFMDSSVFPQLVGLTVGQAPVFLPGGLYAATPNSSIFGAPVFETEHNQALGTAGDILLASMSQYQTITKGGVKAATSIHVAFASDEQAFRFTYRIDGKPLWNTTLTTKSGTACSPFVVLGASA